MVIGMSKGMEMELKLKVKEQRLVGLRRGHDISKTTQGDIFEV